MSEKRESATLVKDPEIAALKHLAAIFGPLPVEARRRLLDYANARWGTQTMQKELPFVGEKE